MSATGLESPSQPIALIPGTTVPTEGSTFAFKQHDNSWNGWDFTATDSSDNVIVKADADNFQKIRHFQDSAGKPLFDLHRRFYHLHNVWTVRFLDGDETVEPPLTGDVKMTLIKVAVDVKMRNAAAGGENLVLEVRGQDSNIVRSHVTVGGRRIMDVTRLLDAPDIWGSSNKLGHRGTWQASVAGGVDLVLAALIVAMVSEFASAWRKR